MPNPQLRLPNPPTYSQPSNYQVVAQKMLDSGYFPMNHLARIPDATSNQPIQTISWYRGPLIPFDAYVPETNFMSGNDPNTSVPLIYSADQLLRFDPSVGMYDVSYAVAWELGRLLSLQNKDFSVALYQWKKQLAQQYRSLVESQILEDMFAEMMDLYNEYVKNETPANEAAHLLLHQTALHHLNKIAQKL